MALYGVEHTHTFPRINSPSPSHIHTHTFIGVPWLMSYIAVTKFGSNMSTSFEPADDPDKSMLVVDHEGIQVRRRGVHASDG